MREVGQVSPERVFLHGNGGDKVHFRDMLVRKKEIDDVWQIVRKHQGLGHADKVKEYTDLALALERDLKKRDTGYQYSFEKKEQEDTLKLGRGEIEELMKLSPEDIQQDIPRMEASIQG